MLVDQPRKSACGETKLWRLTTASLFRVIAECALPPFAARGRQLILILGIEADHPNHRHRPYPILPSEQPHRLPVPQPLRPSNSGLRTQQSQTHCPSRPCLKSSCSSLGPQPNSTISRYRRTRSVLVAFRPTRTGQPCRGEGLAVKKGKTMQRKRRASLRPLAPIVGAILSECGSRRRGDAVLRVGAVSAWSLRRLQWLQRPRRRRRGHIIRSAGRFNSHEV